MQLNQIIAIVVIVAIIVFIVIRNLPGKKSASKDTEKNSKGTT